jgi:DNA helicase-2/ATP-dependent DNA helicase PcrA
MDWKDGLNDEQQKAAAYSGSHARLLAGPGTGKTFTLTRRIVRLFVDLKKPAGSILAFTFTKFVAAELRRRVAAVEEKPKEEKTGKTTVKKLPCVSTLHSYALRELLRNESRTKLPHPIRISDDWEDECVVMVEMQALMSISKDETRKLFAKLSADWQQLSADQKDWERSFPDPKFLGAWREHREIYGYTMRAELVYQLKNSLEEGAIEIEGPPEHVLVDEFQDLNPCDLAVVSQMARLGCEIYGAGDDDQSIYGFRYAEPEGIRRFPEEFKPSKQLELIHCKRCDKAILDFALFVARQDHRRIEKKLEADSKESGQVEILWFENEGVEALGIGKICRWLVKRKGLKPEDILILLRSDRNKAFSTPLSAALINVGVPVNISSNPLEPLEIDSGREFLSLLRLIGNQRDDLAWRSILQVRKNGLGATTFRAGGTVGFGFEPQVSGHLLSSRGQRVSLVPPAANPTVHRNHVGVAHLL